MAVKKVAAACSPPAINDALRPGDAIDVMTPQGRFGVAAEPAAARTYLAIAAGSGITPVMSLVRTRAVARAAEPTSC